MILRNFCNREGKLWVGDRRRNKLFETSPRNAFVEKWLYARHTVRLSRSGHLECDRSNEFEDALACIENDAAPAIRCIIDSVRMGEWPKLSSEQWHSCKLFLLAIARRTRESQQRITAGQKPFRDIFYDACAAVTDGQGVILPRRASIYDDPRMVDLMTYVKANADARFASGTGARAQRRDEQYCRTFQFSMAVITIPSKRSFIIGSHGLAVLTERNGPASCWFPIAHDVALTPVTVQNDPWLLSLDRSRDNFIRQINESSSSLSHVIAGPSRRLVQRLMMKAQKKPHSGCPPRP